jgi:hypothetical protein
MYLNGSGPAAGCAAGSNLFEVKRHGCTDIDESILGTAT